MTDRLPTQDMLIEARINYIVRKAKEIGIEPGWLWLYRNDFKRRVPAHVKEKVEDSQAFLIGGNDD